MLLGALPKSWRKRGKFGWMNERDEERLAGELHNASVVVAQGMDFYVSQARVARKNSDLPQRVVDT